MKILITGAAGFIGYHITRRLAGNDKTIVCIDNVNDYYDVALKHGRLKELGIDINLLKKSGVETSITSSSFPSLNFYKMDLCDATKITALLADGHFDVILHIAAQAGVRFSLENPTTYISSNIQGFLNILEAARLYPPKHLIYASSSSVYGLNDKVPFSELDIINKPASLYAVTKQSNEQMAYVYSHLFRIPSSGLRFFTVYGPWGRPDMAPFIFTKAIIEGKPINVFNNGNMKRDFTYIDDIIEGTVRLINKIPETNKTNSTPAALYNIGNGRPVPILDFIHSLEEVIGKKAILNNAPMQDGDVISTWADCSALEHKTGFKPNTPLPIGIKKFVDWYKEFYH